MLDLTKDAGKVADALRDIRDHAMDCDGCPADRGICTTPRTEDCCVLIFRARGLSLDEVLAALREQPVTECNQLKDRVIQAAKNVADCAMPPQLPLRSRLVAELDNLDAALRALAQAENGGKQ